MNQLTYGKKDQVNFANFEEKFQSIGFVCNPDNASIVFEENSKTHSWGDAYRFHIHNTISAPQALQDALRTQSRINCNELCEALVNTYGFVRADSSVEGDYNTVLSKIPSQYQQYFIDGYNL